MSMKTAFEKFIELFVLIGIEYNIIEYDDETEIIIDQEITGNKYYGNDWLTVVIKFDKNGHFISIGAEE
jgi:regulatory protein YycI of two-component signal transduction system YycFG